MSRIAIVSLIMRVGLGILFLVHGVKKFQMGLGNVAAWFDTAGVPGFLAYIAGPLELIGGILLIAGLLTRYVSILLVLQLIGAIFIMKLPAGLLGNGQMAGYELDIAYILVGLHLAAADRTPLSIDGLFLFRSKDRAVSGRRKIMQRG
ncbi:DoxX family protein [Paenibacillus caui]|uniref:DoxX family protein n=1 Tax=Paenibacillus caui TaxID=2873927 RepID=UPI001CA83327|nr:DoxX family protein [Paenibacillus caui]